MLELTIPVYLICLGFIAGSWDHQYQRKSSRGWENENLGQPSKASLRMTYLRLETETLRPENSIALIMPSLQKSQPSRMTAIISGVLTEYKGVELSDKGK